MYTVPESVTSLSFQPPQLCHPSPLDWRDQFIYFLLVDRFDNNADLPPFASETAARGRAHEQGRRFQGGNLKGITRRLDYIQGLGCTAIWLSPIFKNRTDLNDTYHGYGVQDFLDVDPRFGTLEDLQELTRKAHARGMYVIQDIIFNHTGDVWAYPKGNRYYYYQGQQFPFGFWRETDPAPELQRNDGVWPRELQSPDVFKRQGEIRSWDDDAEAMNGDFFSLKELDINQHRVLDTMIKAYKHWISLADIDGFRVDTVKHMEHSAVAIFCNAIREYAQRVGKHNFFLFGEIVDDDATIQRYLGRNARIDGTNERFPSLDAALDFPLYFNLEDVIKGFKNPAVLRERYETMRNNYTDHGEAGRYFVTFIDNHDQMARPYRRFMHNNPHPQQAVLAMGYLLTSLGVPCIYYGTEQGFDGGGDSDIYVRECMFGGQWGAFDTTGVHFFNKQHPIYQGIKAIAQLRHREPALRYGRQYFREISGDGSSFGHPLDSHATLAYSRILDTEEILITMNLDGQPRSDFITVDYYLSSPKQKMRNLLNPNAQPLEIVERNNRACVQVPLGAHEIAILKV
ncbi:MAG: alpha-amylase family glycosyl hydrolase [Pseudomonadota bacterium]